MRILEIDLEEAARRPLTPSEIAQLEAAGLRVPDTGDIPELPPEAWATAVRGKFYKPRKDAISLRLDMDVLAWLRRYRPKVGIVNSGPFFAPPVQRWVTAL